MECIVERHWETCINFTDDKYLQSHEIPTQRMTRQTRIETAVMPANMSTATANMAEYL